MSETSIAKIQCKNWFDGAVDGGDINNKWRETKEGGDGEHDAHQCLLTSVWTDA